VGFLLVGRQGARPRLATVAGSLIVAAVVVGAVAFWSDEWNAPPLDAPVNLSAISSRQPERLKAVDFVRSEALAMAGSADPDSDAFRAYAAISAANYVRTLMSSARYSLALSTPGTALPSGTEACLADRRGICGNHAAAFIDIMKALRVPAREVQVYYVDKSGARASHMLAEVRWNDAWRMIDVTWGFIPHDGSVMDALSFEQARMRRGTAGWHDEVHVSRASAVMAKADIFEYLTTRQADVLIAGTGIVHPYVGRTSQGRVSYSFDHLPNHVGKRLMGSGLIGEVVHEIELPSGYAALTVVPLHMRCESGTLFANAKGLPVSMQPIVFSGVGRKVVLRIESPGKQCFLDIKELYATKDVRDLQ
jgi:hypothetical protein